MKKILVAILVCCSVAYASKQFMGILATSLGISTSLPTTLTAGTIFSVSSTTKSSMPLPVMTETQRDALTNLTSGQMIFNSTSGSPGYYSNGIWNRNNTTSKTQGVMGLEACTIDNDSGTPTVRTASGTCSSWISALIDTGVGVTGITVISGVFSVVPVCVCAPEVAAGGGAGANRVCDLTITSVTSLEVSIRSTGGAQQDNDFTIMCFGKR